VNLEKHAAGLDWAGRLLGAGFFCYLTVDQVKALSQLLAQPTTGVVFALPVLSRAAVVAFLVLTGVCFLVRSPPVARTPSLVARGVALAAVLLLVVALRRFPPARLSVAEQMAATSLIAAGNVLSVVALMTLGRSFSILPQARRLVTRGLYGFVRHPLYLAYEMSVLGSLWFYRAPAMVPLYLLHLGLQLWRIAEEERLLLRVFPEYEDYRRRTRWRLLPGVY
jgi:protein-S-isoprenylcysteine O-methyltransferase Ste14